MNAWAALLFGTRARRRFLVQLAVLLAATVLGVVFAQRFVPGETAVARSESLVRGRRLGPAERLLWSELARGPVTVDALVMFLDNHHTQRILELEGIDSRGERFIVPEEDIDALLARADVPEDVRVLGRFWRGVLKKEVPDDLRARVVAMAVREPPVPFANRLLGREAHREGHLSDAVARFEREGLAFPERSEDLALAMQLLAYTDSWDELERRILDPRVGDRVPPSIRYAYAVRVKNVRLALRSLVASALAPRPAGPLAMTFVSGFMWLLFALRMGRSLERPAFRVPLFATALVLGVLSVFPTLVLVGLEESLLHFKERGDIVSDVIFFTVGVGLREEVSKLLLFLPLLPLVLRKGTRLDALTCGAIVGLGFASEENVAYLQQGLATALARFLTANFLHMALSGLLAVAAYDLAREGERGVPAFSRSLLVVVAMHGAYDFFLSNPQVEGLGFLSMTIFVLLTRMFMTALRHSTTTAGAPLLPRFAQAVAVVTCASFVYASAFVGPIAAAFVLAEGLLGMVLIVVMFVQEIAR